jgi:hypothetical protein
MTFIIPSRSPAVRLANALFAKLADDGEVFWLPIRGLAGWTQQKYQFAVAQALTVIGHVTMRLIWNFKTFPWLLGRLYAPETSLAESVDIANAFFVCDATCYEPGLPREIRNVNPDADALRTAAANKDWVMEMLGNCPCHNIANEDRFARTRTHNIASHGKQTTGASMCSKHVSSEWAAWHTIGVDRYPPPPAYVAASITQVALSWEHI